MSDERSDGYVKNVIEPRGFGFIAVTGGGDLFFHCRDVAEGLEFDERLTGLRVTFSTIASPKGPRAVDIRPAD